MWGRFLVDRPSDSMLLYRTAIFVQNQVCRLLCRLLRCDVALVAIVYFHLPHWTVCPGDVGAAQSAKKHWPSWRVTLSTSVFKIPSHIAFSVGCGMVFIQQYAKMSSWTRKAMVSRRIGEWHWTKIAAHGQEEDMNWSVKTYLSWMLNSW